MDEALRVGLACVALFGVVGFGLVRLWLPDALRRHELLWILPAGACGLGFAMTPLGFLGVPHTLNFVLVWLGGLALSVHAVRTRGWPARPEFRAIGWPAYVGLLLIAIALIPMFRSGFATVVGEGSDVHLAVGTAEFLRHARPLEVKPELPVDQMPLVWRSKHAIYYPFGAVATAAGMETWEVVSTLTSLLLALAAVGMFVLAREMLGATVGVAAVAMAIAGLDRMVLHTGMHPYYNQTWGYMTVPFALVLSWWVIRHPSRGAVALLALFLLVGAFAYPLAVPIPLTVLGVMWLVDRHDRRKRGERVFGRRELMEQFRALGRGPQIAGYVLFVLLLVPLFGVFEKISGAAQLILNPGYSLVLWGGDLKAWFPEQQFFAIHIDGPGWWVAFAVVVYFCVATLRRLPKAVALGLLSVMVVAAVIAGTMRLREYGWYFHFKMLAFVGPLVIVCAAVAMARVRRWHAGLVMLALWSMWGAAEAREETRNTYDELPRTMLQLRDWGERLPESASIRLDMQPGTQLWVAYMLHEHPLCSQRPLDNTSYPHVPNSRAADYVLVRALHRPYDAVGPPIFQNVEFRLYELEKKLPGGDRCSQRMIQTVSEIRRT